MIKKSQKVNKNSKKYLLFTLFNLHLDSMPTEVIEHIKSLEKEIKRLRQALNELLKINSTLKCENIKMKQERIEELNGKCSVASISIDEFCKTLNQINQNSTIKKSGAFLPRIRNQFGSK